MSNAFDLYLQTAHRLQIPAGVLVLMADGRDSGPLCNGAGCTMSAEIPISMDSYNSSRQLACTRLEPGANSELPLSIAIDEYNPADVRVSSSGTVHCPSTHLGPHIVIQVCAGLGCVGLTIRWAGMEGWVYSVRSSCVPSLGRGAPDLVVHSCPFFASVFLQG
eukprot:860163-Pelagomonas_calceolata.AAC.2